MIPVLILQTVATASSLETEVASHPFTVVVGIGALFAGFVAVVKLFLVFFERRIDEKFTAVEQHNLRQDARLDDIEGDLQRYDRHVAVGVQESSAIHDAMARVEAALHAHVEKEENVTWAKIDALVNAINDMKLANEVAHRDMTAASDTLAVRLDSVERKLPNGELTKLAEAYSALAAQATRPRARRK